MSKRPLLGESSPISQRSLERIQNIGDLGLTIALELSSTEEVSLKVLDYHSEGVRAQVLTPEDVKKLTDLTTVALSLKYGNQILYRVEAPKVVRFDTITGTAVFQFKSTIDRIKMRDRQRLKPKTGFEPVVMAHHPFNPDELLHFTVLDFSSDGMLLQTSLSNRSLVPGMLLSGAQIILPGVGILLQPLKITRMVATNRSLLCGVSFIEKGRNLSSSLGQFALFAEQTYDQPKISKLEQLKVAGLLTKQIGKALKFSIVSGASEYKEALSVRWEAYSHAAKLPQDADLNSVSDNYDERSVIIIGRHNRKAVCTIRIVTSNSELEVFPFESVFKTDQVKNLVRNETCEISKLAVLPEYQNTDVLLWLLRRTFQSFIRLKLKRSFCIATTNLSSLYKRLGAIELASGAPHPYLKSETFTLYELEMADFLSAKHMPALCWERLVKDAAFNLADYGFLTKPKTWQINLRIRAERFFIKLRTKIDRSKEKPK